MKMWQAKLKVDLAELKGPPSLAMLEKKKADRLADLDLLINSGKYKEGAGNSRGRRAQCDHDRASGRR